MNLMQEVLIVDDNVENCKQIKYALQTSGIDAHYTQSAVDSIDCLLRHGYHLITMPEQDGFKLLEVMRRMTDMPIMVLSSHREIEKKKQAYCLGADDYLQKPLDLADCLLRVQALLRRCNGFTHQKKSPRRYTIVNFEDLFMDPSTRRITHNSTNWS